MRESARPCAVGCALLVASLCVGCAGGSRGEGVRARGAPVVARVGDVAITKTQLDRWAGLAAAVEGTPAADRAALARRVLKLFVAWQWMLGEARERGLRVSEAQAARQLSLSQANLVGGVAYEWLPHERAIQPYLSSSRVDARDRLWVVRMALLAARLEQARAALARRGVTRAQVLAYYRRHRRRFVIHERRDIKAVMNASERRVLEAKRAIQAGVPFRIVAARFNESREGGLRLGRGRGSASKQYERDFFAAPPHVLIGPRREILYYVFEVIHVRPPHMESVAQAEPAIRRTLAEQRASGGLLRAYERKWRARTRCSSGYSVAGCAAVAGEPRRGG